MEQKKQLKPGDTFTCEGIEWIILDDFYGYCLSITAQPIGELPFDTESSSDWTRSSLRRVLNLDFLDRLDRRHIVFQVPDLTPAEGSGSYGVCLDRVTVLSLSQYRKYGHLLPVFSNWVWTLTPMQCSTSSATVVDVLYGSPDIGPSSCDHAQTFATVFPVCLFNSYYCQAADEQSASSEEGGEHDD